MSKAFGAGHAVVHQADNSKGLSETAPAHGAARIVPTGPHTLHNPAHTLHAAPLAHAPLAHASLAHAPLAHAPLAHAPLVHAPLTHAPLAHAPLAHTPLAHTPLAHATLAHAPLAHAPLAHAPLAPASLSHAPLAHAPLAHAPLAHAPLAPAPAPYAEEVYEPSPYAFEYAVADDYSKAAFNAAETSDGAGTVTGSYSVALPDGRTQHVTYKADGYNGFVAEVTYEGQAVYPKTSDYAPAPVAHAVHAAPVAHAVHA